MISKSRTVPSLTSEPEGDADATYKTSPRLDESRASSKKYRDEKTGRPSNRGHGRGRGGYSDSYTKTRVFIESKDGSGKGAGDAPLSRQEDSRISKILRKLSRENDADKFLALTKQLQDVLLLPENSTYLRHSMDLVVESLLDQLHSAPSTAAREESARCLGRTGYALHTEFRRFLDWLFGRFSRERNESVRVLLMKALMTTALLEVEKPMSRDMAPAMMLELKMALESADSPELVISCVDVILILNSAYPDSLTPYFRDTVDILVGWGLSLKEQSSINFALRSLLELERYWLADTAFTISLLTHFLEDLEANLEDMLSPPEGQPPITAQDILTLLRIFNTVASCVVTVLSKSGAPMTSSVAVASDVDGAVSAVTGAALSTAQGPSLSKLLKNAEKALSLCPSDLLVTTINIGASLLLAQFHDLAPASILIVLEYISKLMTLLPQLDTDATIATLQFITKVVTELGTGLPADLATSLLGPGAPLAALKTSSVDSIVDNLIQLYRAFFLQPTMFQQMLWLIKSDTDESVAVLVSPNSEARYTECMLAADNMAFHLQTVSEVVLAGKGGAGILELLLRWRPESSTLAIRCPSIHYALLTLCTAHSTRCNHFVTSGIVLSPESSYQFPAVVLVLTRLLSDPVPTDTVVLALSWTREMLHSTQPYLQTLLRMEYFVALISAIIKIGKFKYNDHVVMLVGSCLQIIFSCLSFISKHTILGDLLELCCYHANSLNAEISGFYTNMVPCIPLAATLTKVTGSCDQVGRHATDILAAHVTHDSHALISPRNFKLFVEYLLYGAHHENDDWLREIFLESYPLGLQGDSATRLALKHSALQSRSVLIQWSCYEAAQMCVLNKLRTSLGKPPETFTAFEAALKTVARDNTALDSASVHSITRARMLLEFMEWLEKMIYNASEGTAVTLPAAPKSVRTFFHANKNTCVTWLTRIRLVVGMVAVRAGMPASAVRNLYALLADLHNSNITQSAEFESAVVYCACALLALGDSEAITGLYVWCHKEADRKLPWLLPMAHQAGHRFELAIEGYRSYLCKSVSPVSYESPDKRAEANSVGEDGISSSKSAKAAVESVTLRLLYHCIMDCYRKTHNFEGLLYWLEKSQNIPKNGTAVDKSLDPPWSCEDVTFLASFQEILMNKSSKYRWRSPVASTSPSPNHDAIKALDTSILDAKIAKANSGVNDRCKQALSQLSDWSQIIHSEFSPHWRMEIVMENVKQSLIKDVALVQIGQTLESKSFVLQMSENNKIEIDLHMNLLMDQWGASYNFELSNILKEVKERYVSGKEIAMAKVESRASLVNALLHERLRSGRLAPARDLFMISAVCNDILTGGRNVADLNLSIAGEKMLPSDLLLQLSFWKSLLGEDNLKLHVLKSARKEGNLDLASRCLLWHFKGSPGTEKHLVDVCDELVENFDKNMTLVEGELCLQVAKLLYGTGAHESAMDFASLTALKLIRPDNRCEVRECGSRMLLSLAKWLQRMPGHVVPPAVLNLILIPGDVLDNLLHMPCDRLNDQIIIPEDEMAIGKVLAMSVAHCSSLAKTWCQYASWCYRWGRKMVDAASRAEVTLSDADLLRIKLALPQQTPESDLLVVVRILSRTRAGLEEENIQTDLSILETIQSQLRAVPALVEARDSVVSTLIDVWRESQTRINSSYRKAAQAYFKYLHLCSENQYSDTRTLTATLRILRLLVKHAVELQDLLEQELPATPPQPWQGIIPQLFSRLNHPEVYVRARLAELLCRIAQTAPNLIIFPAVVGSSAGANRIADINTSTSKLLASCLSQNSEEEGDDVEDEPEEDEYEAVGADSRESVLTNCYKAMVDNLAKQTPEVIAEVQRFVCELRRITLLWDELWLGTLNQHHGEVTRRLCQLEQEVRKVDKNVSLTDEQKPAIIAEKHRILMKPVVFVLEQLQSITSVTPETPHEVWFQEKLGDAINVALEKLRNPADPRDPAASWAAFRAIHAKLQKRSQKRACTVLKMESISPGLHGLKDTAIPMPGVCGPPVTVASVTNAVLVLPTKTKPKKLVFTSNAGTTHTYLFKGLEDLHLDERIMQFLAIANTMLGAEGSTEFHARHYSVTPLGPRSGLISWVDNVIPLFTLYKKWHQRDVATNQSSLTHSVPTVRPSEMFYNKLTPMLQEAGVPVERRKDWPLPLLKQVLQELMKETPADLLAKELWCNSQHVDDWWETTKRYSRSVAVMSVIGYVIGLGDRHLDNVLIDLHTGEMVHIDYNVCFEKGKTLRVPEKVPFRMTQNIRGALGVTGVEGQFQLSCEHVLKILKQGRETLLPLLEAFVYDPLIDWTPGSETGYTGAVYGGGEAVKETRESRKALEREVTRAMFIVRITEMKAEWLDNKEKVLSVLPEVKSQLERYLELTSEEQKIEESMADAHEQLLVVKEAEAVGAKHSLYNLASRCALLLRARSMRSSLSLMLKDKKEEYEKDLANYQKAVRDIKGEGLSLWMEHVNQPIQPDSYSMFDLVKQFLQTAGQGGMVTQCDQAEAELGQLDTKQRQLLESCTELLRQYGSVIALYPNHLPKHRARKYQLWADRLLLTGPRTEECVKIRNELKSLYGEVRSASSLTSKKVVAYASALQKAVTDAEARMNRALERAKACVVTPEAARAYEEACTRLREMSRIDKKSGLAVELVLIMTLCSVNQRFLKMEAVAKSADDGLEAMRLKDGQGWLEEMYVMSGVMGELAAMLPSCASISESAPLRTVLATLAKTHAIFRELMELHVNFHSIILPEALKCTMTEHPDMVTMMQDLRHTIDSSGEKLDHVQKQLKSHLCALIMNMKSARGEVQTRVSRLRAGLEELLKRPCLDAGRSPGQMLLMGFHHMFDKLTLEGKQMLGLLAQVPILPEWRKLDQIKDATTFTALVLDERTRSVTDDMFLVRRVQTMHDFFALCLRAGASFRGEDAPVVADDDALNRPIRRFTAEFVSRIMLGATSQTLAAAICLLLDRLGLNLTGEIESRAMGSDGRVSLEDMCQHAIDVSLQKGVTSNHLITKAISAVSTMQARYREVEHSKLLGEAVEARERAWQRLEALMTAHSWYFEDLLQDAGANTPQLHSRSTFMTKLRKWSSALLSLQQRLLEARESQRALVASVEQRLRWAGGANPALIEVLAAFEAGISGLDARLDADSLLAAQLAASCTAVLRYEALRTRTSEAVNQDEAMLKILDQWEEVATWQSGCCESLSALEESLLLLMTPESASDPKHLYKIELKISENIEKLKGQRTALAEKMESVRVDCETEMEKLKTLLGNHHALMTEVRQPLKSMARLDEWGGAGVSEYLDKYREFSSNIGVVVSLLTSEKALSGEDVEAAMNNLQFLPEKIAEIYDDLIGFAEKTKNDKKRPPLLRQESVCASPKHLRGPANQRTAKGSQERNAYALSVWRRIQMKLEGRDPDPGRRSAPHEQIDYIIREATSLDNLALLYEGWTPWV